MRLTMKFLKSILPVITAGLFAAGISIVFNSDVGRATFYKWSQVAATNSTADSTINWAEGQSPSSVNDSARAMMAATSKWRDDISGKLLTTGTGTAYVLASNQVFSSLALMDGAMLAFQVNATNGASPTLNVDGLGAKAINVTTAGAGMAAGTWLAGGYYSVTYNSANSAFLAHNISGAVPSGLKILTTSSACPTGFTLDATNNDRALVMSSASGGITGGTTGFSAAFNGVTAGGGTVLTQANMPLYNFFLGTMSVGITDTGHNHSATVTDPGHTHGISPTAAQIIAGSTTGPGGTANASSGATATGSAATGVTVANTAATTGITAAVGGTLSTSGSGTAHTHPNSSIQHVFVIACTKN